MIFARPDNATLEPSARRLDWLQVLRAAAALMVVVHHLRHELGTLGLHRGGPALMPWWAGVDVFFVISGFIMVHATGPDYDRPGGRRRFLAHRVARVVPLYWLVSLLFLAVALTLPRTLGDAGAARDPAYLAASLLFWPMARPDGSLLPLYGLGWTLNYEMFFYAVFALGLGRGGAGGRAGTVAWTAALLAGLVALGALVRPLPAPLAFWSNPIVTEFLLGAGLALLHGRGLSLGPAPRLALALAGSAGLAAFVTEEPTGFARPLLAGLPAALLVAAAALGRGGAVAPRALVRLGDASYALYLVHPFALRAAREGLVRLGAVPVLGGAAVAVAMLACAVAAAFLTYALVERPLNRRLRARLGADDAVAARKPWERAAQAISRRRGAD